MSKLVYLIWLLPFCVFAETAIHLSESEVQNNWNQFRPFSLVRSTLEEADIMVRSNIEYAQIPGKQESFFANPTQKDSEGRALYKNGSLFDCTRSIFKIWKLAVDDLNFVEWDKRVWRKTIYNLFNQGTRSLTYDGLNKALEKGFEMESPQFYPFINRSGSSKLRLGLKAQPGAMIFYNDSDTLTGHAALVIDPERCIAMDVSTDHVGDASQYIKIKDCQNSVFFSFNQKHAFDGMMYPDLFIYEWENAVKDAFLKKDASEWPFIYRSILSPGLRF